MVTSSSTSNTDGGLDPHQSPFRDIIRVLLVPLPLLAPPASDELQLDDPPVRIVVHHGSRNCPAFFPVVFLHGAQAVELEKLELGTKNSI